MTAADPAFSLRTVAEISAYLTDMVKGGGFAAFRVDECDDALRIHIRMKPRDYGNAVKCSVTAAVVRATMTAHGSPDVDVVVGHTPIWMRA